MNLVEIGFLILLCAGLVPAARILGVFPFSAQSHHRMFNGVLRALAERGHEVVSYTSVLHDPVPNYSEIQIDGGVKPDVFYDLHNRIYIYESKAKFESLRCLGFYNNTLSTWSSEFETLTKWINGWSSKMMVEFVSHENLTRFMTLNPVGANAIMLQDLHTFLEPAIDSKTIKELYDAQEQFDVMLCECLMGQEAVLGFAHKFKIPVINIQTFNFFPIINEISGNDLFSSFIPETSIPYTDHMTFYERFSNSLSIMKTLHEYYYHHLPRQEETARRIFKDPSMPPLLDIARNITLFFNNERSNVFFIYPVTPNIVNIGGVHIDTKRKPLPQDLKTFFDEAKHGVIYISMGSVVPDEILPPEYFQNFISVFRRLPKQRFLWKTRLSIQGLPSNVMTSKWVPQQDLLAHPNLLMFMTHGGLMSTHEVLYAGVPVVCVPYFFDQRNNARFYEERGVGIRLLFNELSEDTIYSAFTTIMNDPKYRENMRRLSHIYRDQPMTPQQTAVYWVEYVIKHRGAPHLRPASAALTWYQRWLLDVVAAAMLVLTVIIALLGFFIYKITLILKRNLYKQKMSSKKK